MSNQAVGFVLGGDRNSANAGVHSVGERKIDDARFSAEIDGRFGASIGHLHKATAAPTSKHEGKSVSRKGLMSVCSHLVLPYNARSDSSCSACGRARRKESSYPRRSLMHRGNRGSQTNAPARPLACSSFRRDLSIQPGHTPVATIIGEIDPPLSGTGRTVAVVAGMVLDVAKAAPLPEAKPNDVGFSQQVLARLDDFFAREMAAKNVGPTPWSQSHATISSSTTRGTASSIRQKIRRFRSMPYSHSRP